MEAEIIFVLPFCVESLNLRDRKSYWQRTRDKNAMSMEITAALNGPRHFPRPPWRNVRVTVNRCSAGRLDKDNAVASVKSVLDCLCIKSSRHPQGLGIIEDDSDELCDLIVTQSSAAPGKGSTVVRIERLDV